MPWATPEAARVEVQVARVVDMHREWADGTSYVYLAMSLDSTRLLGIFGLHRRIGPSAIEMGYWLCEDATGHGHATSAAGALTRQALALPGIDRVEIHCDEANGRSRRVPERLGYRVDRIEDDEVNTPAKTGAQHDLGAPLSRTRRCGARPSARGHGCDRA
jgi:RimJ/RimL family protein N-acetyltransferase